MLLIERLVLGLRICPHLLSLKVEDFRSDLTVAKSGISESVVAGLNQGAVGAWGGPLCLLRIALDYYPLMPFQSVLFLLRVLRVSTRRQLGEPNPRQGWIKGEQ